MFQIMLHKGRCVFSTLSVIYDRAFGEITQRLKAINSLNATVAII